MSKELNEPMPSFQGDGYPISKYVAARAEWDDRIGSAVIRARNWRFCALFTIALCLLLTGGIIYQSQKSMVTPFVVMLGVDGAPIAVEKALQTNYAPQEREIKYFLKEWVRKFRSVPLDPVMAKENWVSAYSQLRGAGLNKMRDVMKQENLTGKLGKETVQIDVQVVVPVSSSTYQVRWIETSFSKEGKVIENRKMTGLFSIEIVPPKDEKEVLSNPLGLLIKDVSWSRETN